MDLETLSLRLSECLDDLGLLLDQLYKFPQKQREAYFDKIQSLKNRLLMLKGTLRECPVHTSEKQYKQIYLAMNNLKNQITLQTSALTVAKENRQAQNRVRDVKQAKRNYQDAMRVILDREEEVRCLRAELFQKDELVRANFAELTRMKGDLDMLIQENRRLKFDQTSLQIEYDTLRAAIDRTSDTALQFRVRQQEKDRAFAGALEQLQRLKVELIDANEKLVHFEQLAEVSIRKTRQVEENIKKVQRQAQDLNENYRTRQNDNFRKLREFSEIEFELGVQVEQGRQLQLQNRRLREDVQVLENEIAKMDKHANELRTHATEERERMHLEQKRLMAEIQTGVVREGELKRVIEQAQKKYLLVIGKLNTCEQLKARNRELQIKIQSLQERLKRTQQFLEQSKKESLQYLREKQRAGEQLEGQLRANREIEIEVFKAREKGKVREEERVRLLQELQAYQCRLKESERALAIGEVARESLETQIAEERGRVMKCEERQRIKEKQIEGLKVRLLQAKIQTVHEIREVINA